MDWFKLEFSLSVSCMYQSVVVWPLLFIYGSCTCVFIYPSCLEDYWKEKCGVFHKRYGSRIMTGSI